MPVTVVRLGLALGLLLACTDDGLQSTPAGGSGGASASSGSGAAAPAGGRGGGGGARVAPPDGGGRPNLDGGVGLDASGPDSDASSPERDASGPESGASSDAGIDPNAPILVTLDPSSIEVFDLPINSVRYAAAGFDPSRRLCATLIWDYSNNDLEVGPHCDDFLVYPDFPYVILMPGGDAPCASRWNYGGVAPSSASGCFDPIEDRVDARVEVEVDGVRYIIQATDDLSL